MRNLWMVTDGQTCELFMAEAPKFPESSDYDAYEAKDLFRAKTGSKASLVLCRVHDRATCTFTRVID